MHARLDRGIHQQPRHYGNDEGKRLTTPSLSLGQEWHDARRARAQDSGQQSPPQISQVLLKNSRKLFRTIVEFPLWDSSIERKSVA
eukprot:4219759-Amphidinium_carterae.1